MSDILNPKNWLVLGVIALIVYAVVQVMTLILAHVPVPEMPEISFASSNTEVLAAEDQQALNQAAAAASTYIATLSPGCRGDDFRNFLRLSFQDFLWDYFPPMSNVEMDRYMNAFRGCFDPNDSVVSDGQRVFNHLGSFFRGFDWEVVRALGREAGMKVIDAMIRIMVP